MRTNDEERRKAAGPTRAVDAAPRTTISGPIDLIASMDPVEFYPDEGIYRASYDSTRDSTSTAVVAMIATTYCRDPVELDSLYSAVDVDGLDGLFASSGDEVRDGGRISFRYEGFDVTVFSGGTIEATPVTDAC